MIRYMPDANACIGIINAHARSLDAVLVTHNTGEFGRVFGSQEEDWEGQ